MTDWARLSNDLDETIIPFARLRGASKFGSIGACWGGYAMIRLAGNPNCKFSIGFHASQHGQLQESLAKLSVKILDLSLKLDQNLYGDDYIKIYNEVKNDVFFFNSINEPEQNRDGGLVNQIIGDKFYSKVSLRNGK